MNSQLREHSAYVRGVRHGFVAALWVAIAMAAVGVIFYVTVGQA